MANKKVSQLTSKPSVLTTDLFPIADPSTGQLYKTTISDLGTAIGSGVSSVNSLVGAVVLDTDDIQELVSPTNKWFTDTRARAALSASSPLTYNSGTGAFGIQVANGSQNGYLSSADWNTFNNKMPAITFNSPLFIASGGDVSITLATTSANGYLSSTDWNTFNNKVGGSGTNTYLAMFSASKTLTNSAISYDGSKTTVEAQGLVSLNGLELQGAYNSVSGLKLLSNDSTTGYSYMEFTNTGGGFRLGVNRNTAGGILSGSATYATFLTTTGSTSLQLGANGALILSLNTSGLARFYNQVQIDNTVTATQFIRTGGTSSQFLKADGSVDSSTYLTTGTASSTYLPLSGGTLTGALSGTSASFSGNVAAGSFSGASALFSNYGSATTAVVGFGDSNNGIFRPALNALAIATNGVQRFTIGSDGASAFSSSVSAANNITCGTGAFNTGGFFIPYSTSSSASRNWKIANDQQVFGDFTIQQSTTQSGDPNIIRLYIKNDGNVGIGTTSPGARLHVDGAIYQSNGANGIYNNYYETYNGGSTPFTINASGASSSIQFLVASTERMRITSGGAVLVGLTAAINTSSNTSTGATFAKAYNWLAVTDSNYIQRADSTDGDFFTFYKGSTAVGRITVTGTVTTYVSLSDYRLKQDLKPINGLDIVNKINVYNYEWKSDKTRMDGVLAHELAEVLPYAVSGVKDGEQMQGVDYSKIVPVLIQSIKELKSKIETLENK